jgi:hypothetical protein
MSASVLYSADALEAGTPDCLSFFLNISKLVGKLENVKHKYIIFNIYYRRSPDSAAFPEKTAIRSPWVFRDGSRNEGMVYL